MKGTSAANSRLCSGRVKVFLIWVTWFGGLIFTIELPDVSAAWENRSIVTLMVNSRNHFDRSFWSGDIFMLTIWLSSAGKSYCNGIRKEFRQKWTTRENFKNLSRGFSSISWWRFFHWLFPMPQYLDFGKFTSLRTYRIARKFLLARAQSACRIYFEEHYQQNPIPHRAEQNSIWVIKARIKKPVNLVISQRKFGWLV